MPKSTMGSTRRGETEQRILASARQLFAEVGYERATIRTIAKGADIHPSLVMRYFVDKEGLLEACFQFKFDVPDLSHSPDERWGETIVRAFLNSFDNATGRPEMAALLRISVTHPKGRDLAVRVLTEQFQQLFGRNFYSEDAKTISALTAIQLVGIAFLRYVIKLPDVVELSNERLIKQVGAIIQITINNLGITVRKRRITIRD